MTKGKDRMTTLDIDDVTTPETAHPQRTRLLLTMLKGAAVLALGLVAYAGIRHNHRSMSERFASAREDLAADCARWKSQRGDDDVCHPFEDRPFKKRDFKGSLARVQAARDALDRGDEASAVVDLRAALDSARDFDRHGSLISELFAASIINGALDVMERQPHGLSNARIAALLEGRRLRSADHPLESERLYVSSLLLQGSVMPPLPARPFTGIVATDAVEEEARITSAMERALRVQDEALCLEEAKARRVTKDLGVMVSAEFTCKKLVTMSRTQERLEKARLRAKRG